MEEIFSRRSIRNYTDKEIEKDILHQILKAGITQNILLQATSFNIGSCWIGIAPNENYEGYVRGVLEIPEDIRVFSMVSLGYSEETKDRNDNFYDEKIHYNKY